MHVWPKRIFIAAVPLLLTGCLWGPGKFVSDLTLKKNGSFILDYRGEIVLQTPPESEAKAEPWKAEFAKCFDNGDTEVSLAGQGSMASSSVSEEERKPKPCSPTELTKLKKQYEEQAAERAKSKREEAEQMAKMFGIAGLDDASGREFAAKLSKYAGYRSVQYRGKGVFDVDYHFEGRATQDFVFPMLPDNDFMIPFVSIRRRGDGAVLVTAPAFTGGSGPMGVRAGAAAAGAMKEGQGPVSRAQGRFTVITDGEILTNNSEDGAAAHPAGKQVHWDVSSSSSKIPETLIRLQ